MCGEPTTCGTLCASPIADRARLHIFEDSGHVGSEAMGETVRAAIEEFTNR